MEITLNMGSLEFIIGMTLGIMSGFSIGYFIYLHKEGEDHEN